MFTRFLRSGCKALFWLIVFVVLLSVAAGVILGLLTGVASAQEAPQDNQSITQSAYDNPTEDCRVLDGNLYICDKSLDDGTAELEFYAENDTTIKLGDAGVFLAGGKMNIETFELNGGRVETVRFDVTVKNGKSGVSISTPEGQYGEPLDNGMWTPQLPGEPTSADWAVAAFTVLITATAIVGGCTWWFRKGRGGVVRVF